MKARILTSAILLLVIVTGCQGQATEAEIEAPEGVISAREAALTHVRAAFNAPLPVLASQDWTTDWISTGGLMGKGGYEFTADTCTVTITYPVVEPEEVEYRVTINEPALALQWEGVVDARGMVTDLFPTSAELYDYPAE